MVDTILNHIDTRLIYLGMRVLAGYTNPNDIKNKHTILLVPKKCSGIKRRQCRQNTHIAGIRIAEFVSQDKEEEL